MNGTLECKIFLMKAHWSDKTFLMKVHWNAKHF